MLAEIAMTGVVLQTQFRCIGGKSNPLLLLALLVGTWLVIRLIHSAFKKGGAGHMDKSKRIAIVAALIAAVVVVIIAKQNDSAPEPASPPQTVEDAPMVAARGPKQLTGQGRPTLIELGSDTCIPCKMMAPILSELKNEYAGSLDVHFLDVHQDQDLIPLYKVTVIPLQIFYDAAGNELFRHEGFFAKADILAKWKELGVELVSGP
jgi:thioredoxin 1